MTAPDLVSLPGMPAPEDEIAEVSRECPDCGELITGKERGAGSIAWRMGTHRRVKHGVKGEGRKSRAKAKPGAPTEADHVAHPIISAVREAAAEVGGGRGAPTAAQLGDALGRGLGIAVMGGATLAVETDRALTTDTERDAVIDYLSLSDDAAKALMRPVGRMFAPTKLNARYGRAVVDNVDVLGSIAELVLLGTHWREYLRLRAQSNAILAQQTQAQSAAGMTPPAGPVLYSVPAQPAQYVDEPPSGFVAGTVASGQPTEVMHP